MNIIANLQLYLLNLYTCTMYIWYKYTITFIKPSLFAREMKDKSALSLKETIFNTIELLNFHISYEYIYKRWLLWINVSCQRN